MKKIIVIEADLEGASLVDSIDMMTVTGEGYVFACDRLAHDLDAAILGCFDGGADEVRFEDGHGGGGNIRDCHRDPAAYPGIARAVQVSLNDPASLDGVSGYIQLNMHAMAGTANAFLDHTQSSVAWHNLWLNGRLAGEIAQGAYLAGARGIPYIMMSGDRAAYAEAKALVPDAVCVEVKHAPERNRAVCVGGDEAGRLIREAARLAVSTSEDRRPTVLPLPAAITVEFNRTDYCDTYLRCHPGLVRLDARTVTRTITSIRAYGDMMP